MTTSPFVFSASTPVARPVQKKRVLLIDTSTARRDLRADAMRKLGLDVDCACDIHEARSWWRPDLYNLVLVNMQSDSGERDKFCEDVRGATPAQHLVFLVGKPEYLAGSPNADMEFADGSGIDSVADQTKENVPPVPEASPLQWGIMAASRRISQVRSVAVARTTAMRNRPTPPRDLEVRESRRSDISELAIGLQREGLL
jgi:CheY-like chemotaxis protein